MASITAAYELAATFTAEFDKRLYFRIEILRHETGQPVQITEYISEVYQLRYPNGAMAHPSEGSDTRFRQSWLYLEDFPIVSNSSIEATRNEVATKLADYADTYLGTYKAELKRA